MEINEDLIREMQRYLLLKTGINYFSRIKVTPKDIMVSCPFHKGGQERKPSFGIKRFTDENDVAGACHCFSCGKVTDIGSMLEELLGSLYDSVEVETKFNITGLRVQNILQEQNKPLFELPKKQSYVNTEVLSRFRTFHPYLVHRNIKMEVAELYDIGFDSVNGHITFPLRIEDGRCIGIGRRSISEKMYYYPQGLVKPVYGLYELRFPIRYLYVVEGPFNLWSLAGWGKKAVALLGTGTSAQYKRVGEIECDGYVLALDPDEAGRNGINKLGNYLESINKRVYVADIPEGKDVNDLSFEEFRQVAVLPFWEWQTIYKKF